METTEKKMREIVPNNVYDAADCCDLLGVSRATLTKLMHEKGFPLKAIHQGRILGQQIIDWMVSLPHGSIRNRK